MYCYGKLSVILLFSALTSLRFKRDVTQHNYERDLKLSSVETTGRIETGSCTVKLSTVALASKVRIILYHSHL